MSMILKGRFTKIEDNGNEKLKIKFIMEKALQDTIIHVNDRFLLYKSQ